jgi:hypothetical protein
MCYNFDVDVHTEVCYRQVGWSGPVFEFEIARSRCCMATVHNSVASMASMEPNKLMKVFRTWRQRVKILEFMKANKVEFALTLTRFISADACKSVEAEKLAVRRHGQDRGLYQKESSVLSEHSSQTTTTLCGIGRVLSTLCLADPIQPILK